MSQSGIAVVCLDSFEPVYITSIGTSPDDTHGERLHEQREYMKEVVGKYPPERIYIEQGFTKFNKATQAIYRSVGVFNELLKDYPQEYLAVGTVKKTISGNGRCSKQELEGALLEKYPDLEFANHDESDALAVAYTGLIKSKRMKEW